MNSELRLHLQSLTRFVYFVTDEEARFLQKLKDALGKREDRAKVFNAAFGLRKLPELITDWSMRTHTENVKCPGINEALIEIYKDDPRDDQNFYVITDADRWLKDDHVQRRVLNIAHQLYHDDKMVKVVIFTSPRLLLPQRLRRYIEVVYDTGLNDEEYQEIIDDVCAKCDIPPPRNMTAVFRGLTSYEADSAIAQSIVRTRNETKTNRINPRIIMDYKRRQLSKTDLVKYIDVSDFDFSKVGGLHRFKDWVERTKPTWTEEGQKFGLRPPKGVLAVGVWGCGKSLSVKAMGNAWRLPVIQLDTGRLRSSGVGETENNTIQAFRLIESVAPCLVWIDEAEKNLSGSQSSSFSDSGITARMIGLISTWLQETKAQVCLAMTANSLATLPIEFINRMDERFMFGLPEEEERVDILKIHIAARGQDPKKFQLAKLADAAKQMVGREIEQAIDAAMTESFHANCDGLDFDILVHELKSKPRIYKTMVDELRAIIDWVGFDEEIKDGIRARFASNPQGEFLKLVGQAK